MYHLFGQKPGLGSKPVTSPPGITQKEKPMGLEFTFEDYPTVDKIKEDAQAMRDEAERLLDHIKKERARLPSIFTELAEPVAPEPIVEPIPDIAPPLPPEPPVVPPPPVSPEPPPAQPEPAPPEQTASLEELAGLLEKINAEVIQKVSELEELVKQRSAEIRRDAKLSMEEAIEFARKMKEVMYESELKNLELQAKHMEILDAAEERALNRTLKMKDL